MIIVAVLVLTASAVGAAGITLVTGLGNAGGGKLAQQANAAAKTHLVGPKGTGLTRGITSSSILVGCVYTKVDYAGYQHGIEAAFNQINKTGGVDGRKLKLLVPCDDDANSAQTNVSDNQQLVNQDHVFAVLALSAWELPSSTNFLNSNQVPTVSWGFNPGFCGYRWEFGWNGCLGGNAFKEPVEAIAGNLANAIVKASGLKPSKVRFAVQAQNNISGTSGNAQYVALFKTIGAKVVYAKTDYPAVSAGVDPTPYAQAIVAAKPNIIYLSTDFSSVGPLASAIRAAGYKGIIMDFTNYIPGLLPTSPQLAKALQGEYVNTQEVPNEEETPYVKQVASGLTAVGSQPFVTLGAFQGYSQADMLVQMLQAVGKKLNTKTFDQKINGGGFTAFASGPSGGPGKLIWPAAHYIPADCAAIVKVSGTQYHVVEPFSCYQSYKVVGG